MEPRHRRVLFRWATPSLVKTRRPLVLVSTLRRLRVTIHQRSPLQTPSTTSLRCRVQMERMAIGEIYYRRRSRWHPHA